MCAVVKDWIVIAVKPLVVNRKHIFRPLPGPHGVSYVLDVEKFGRVGAAERSVIDRMGTGDAQTWFGPAAIRLKFWGTPSDLPRASVNLLAVLTASRGGKD